jgi:GTPase SAR1 family protein
MSNNMDEIQAKSVDNRLKIILLGDSAVGKTKYNLFVIIA